MPGIASAATAVVIGHVAAGTSTIRVGAGGIMLPNHAPLVIAEQFGTLESLYPGRIDLGLGRAPGTDQRHRPRAPPRPARRPTTSRRTCSSCSALLGPVQPGQAIRAVPGAGLEVPLWILGSSTFGAAARGRARPALRLRLPLRAGPTCSPALELYRSEFRPSAQLAAPYAMAGVNVFAADTDEEARRLFTSPQQALREPLPRRARAATAADRRHRGVLDAGREGAGVGDARRTRSSARPRPSAPGSSRFVEPTGVDEVMVVTAIYDHAARVRSYEILAEAAAARAATGARGRTSWQSVTSLM